MSEEESWRRRELGVTSFDRTFWHPAAGQGNLTGLAVTWRQETGQDGPGRNGICSWTGQLGWAGNYLAAGNWTEWTIVKKSFENNIPGISGTSNNERMSWWRRNSRKFSWWHPQALGSGLAAGSRHLASGGPFEASEGLTLSFATTQLTSVVFL